jgi:hypothetical protein
MTHTPFPDRILIGDETGELKFVLIINALADEWFRYAHLGEFVMDEDITFIMLLQIIFVCGAVESV